MEVIFLSREDLRVLDFGYVNNDYQIVIDSVIPQKSTFIVNKQNLKAGVGDLLVVKSKIINYIGIIVSIEEEKDKYTSKVQTSDFISILDIQVKLNSYTGNLSLYLYNLIRSAYVVNSDTKQNMSYLNINRDYANINGSLNFEADTINSISSVLETLNKAYSIGVFYALDYGDRGEISGITLHIRDSKNGLVLKSDLSILSNLSISQDSTQSTNKIVFIPSSSNTTYRNTICYYLLTDGSITNNSNDSRRYKTIYSVSKIFKDADYSTLSTTAQSEMLASSLEHSIKFDIALDNQLVVPFKDLNVGDFIEFITPNKTYKTLVTQLVIKNSLEVVNFTLGEYRGTLTDKISLLNKSRR